MVQIHSGRPKNAQYPCSRPGLRNRDTVVELNNASSNLVGGTVQHPLVARMELGRRVLSVSYAGSNPVKGSKIFKVLRLGNQMV